MDLILNTTKEKEMKREKRKEQKGKQKEISKKKECFPPENMKQVGREEERIWIHTMGLQQPIDQNL
jgi:hypothetical protein